MMGGEQVSVYLRHLLSVQIIPFFWSQACWVFPAVFLFPVSSAQSSSQMHLSQAHRTPPPPFWTDLCCTVKDPEGTARADLETVGSCSGNQNHLACPRCISHPVRSTRHRAVGTGHPLNEADSFVVVYLYLHVAPDDPNSVVHVLLSFQVLRILQSSLQRTL